MFRQPDTLLEAIDVMQDGTLGLLHAAFAVTGIPRQFIPMHKGAGGFMSNEQFEKFYWPTFKALIEECVAAGITPMPLFEGDYTPRLKYLAELPPGKVAAHFDRIDRKKFKEILGDKMCFWGNIAPSVLCTGTPQQVKDDVKELIDLFGETGSSSTVPAGSRTRRSPRTWRHSLRLWRSSARSEAALTVFVQISIDTQNVVASAGAASEINKGETNAGVLPLSLDAPRGRPRGVCADRAGARACGLRLEE